MSVNNLQSETLAHCQHQVTELKAEVERLSQENEVLRSQLQQSEHLNTELQQTLDRLTEAEDSLSTLFDLSTVGFYFGRLDPPISITLPVEEQCEQLYQNFRVMRANQAFADMYGANHPDEVVGMGNPDCHVEASEKNNAFIRGIIENGYKIRNLETEEIDRDGQPRYFLNSCTGVIRDGYYAGGWATQIDITELRLAQQALLQAEQDRVAELARTNQALRNNLDRLAAEPNLDAFLGHVLTEISQQLNMHTAWLYRYDPQHQTIRLNNWVEQGTVQSPERFTELEALAETIAIDPSDFWGCSTLNAANLPVKNSNSFKPCLNKLPWQFNSPNWQQKPNKLPFLKNETVWLAKFTIPWLKPSQAFPFN
jgi:PAS domain S-box-containing protein